MSILGLLSVADEELYRCCICVAAIARSDTLGHTRDVSSQGSIFCTGQSTSTCSLRINHGSQDLFTRLACYN